MIIELNREEIEKILIEYIKKKFGNTVILEDAWWYTLTDEACLRFTLQEEQKIEEVEDET